MAKIGKRKTLTSLIGKGSRQRRFYYQSEYTRYRECIDCRFFNDPTSTSK